MTVQLSSSLELWYTSRSDMIRYDHGRFQMISDLQLPTGFCVPTSSWGDYLGPCRLRRIWMNFWTRRISQRWWRCILGAEFSRIWWNFMDQRSHCGAFFGLSCFAVWFFQQLVRINICLYFLYCHVVFPDCNLFSRLAGLLQSSFGYLASACAHWG